MKQTLKEAVVTFVSAAFGVLFAITLVYLCGWWR